MTAPRGQVPRKAFVATDERRHRLCRSERTDKGPRRIVIADLGPAREKRCRSLGGAVLYWHDFRDSARDECAVEIKRLPEGFRRCRQWQRALSRQRRAERRLRVLYPLLSEFENAPLLVLPRDLDAIKARRNLKRQRPSLD